MSVKKRKTNNTQKKNNLKYKLKKNQRRRRTRNKKKINKMKGGTKNSKWELAKQVLESKPSMAQVVVDLKMEKGEAFTHCFQDSCPMLISEKYLSDTNYLLENNCTTQPGPLCPKKTLEKTSVERYLTSFYNIRKFYDDGTDLKIKTDLQKMTKTGQSGLDQIFLEPINNNDKIKEAIRKDLTGFGLNNENIINIVNDDTFIVENTINELVNPQNNYITKTLENIKEKIGKNTEERNTESNSRNNLFKIRKKILYKDYKTKLAPFDKVIENVKKIDIFDPENKAIFLKIIDFIIFCLEDLDNITGINMSLSSLDLEVYTFISSSQSQLITGGGWNLMRHLRNISLCFGGTTLGMGSIAVSLTTALITGGIAAGVYVAGVVLFVVLNRYFKETEEESNNRLHN